MSTLPKDQTGILFYLIFSKLAGSHGAFLLDSRGHTRELFEEELTRYASGLLADGTPVPFDPFSQTWRADNYVQSTVFGRVINGSHWWTHPEKGFILRDPPTGWPAKFEPHPHALHRLRNRTTPPNLTSANKISLAAMTAWYYRFEDVTGPSSGNCEPIDVIKYYLSSLHMRPKKAALIFSDVREEGGTLQVNPYTIGSLKITLAPLTISEATSIFPPRTHIIELRKNMRVFESDFDKIKAMKKPGEDDADVVRRLLDHYESPKP